MNEMDFELQQMNTIVGQLQTQRSRILSGIEVRLAERDRTMSSHDTDEEIYRIYINLFANGLILNCLVSDLGQTGREILAGVARYEREHGVKVGKRPVLYALSTISLLLNDHISTFSYWEQAVSEGQSMDTVPVSIFTTELKDKFTSLLGPISRAYDSIPIIQLLKQGYPNIIESYTSLLDSLPEPESGYLLTLGSRYVQVDESIENYSAKFNYFYAQELINGLCILLESYLKKHPKAQGATKNTLWPIITSLGLTLNLPVAGSNVTNMSALQQIVSHKTFNTSYPQVLALLKGGGLDADSVKGVVLYAVYLLRNQSLHSYDVNATYFNSPETLKEAIGVAFASLSIVKNL